MYLKKALIYFLIASTAPLFGEAEKDAFLFESREEVPEQYKWDLSLFYADWEAWEADMARMKELYDSVLNYRGRLAEGPEVLLEALQLWDEAGITATRVWGYVSMYEDLDTRASKPQEQLRKLYAVDSDIGANLSWFTPELLEIPKETIVVWIDETPALEEYRFGLMDTYRTGEYVLDAEGERLLSLHYKVRLVPSDVFSALTNADAESPEVILADGSTFKVTSGSYGKALNSFENPEDRLKVQKAWMEQFEDRSNTFAAIYNGVLQQGWSLAESRGYDSTLEMELSGDNVPMEVIETLVETAKTARDDLVRFHKLRKNLMALDRYGWSDMHMALVDTNTTYDYDTIVPLVVDSVKILGEEYHSKMLEQFESGLVDVFETPGKRSGAYNTGRYGVGSFVLLNYNGTINDVFTVAHEMGHSMHSRLSAEYQPYSTHRYTIFVAEVASVFNEKLLLKELLESVTDPLERVALIEQQIDAIHGTFFLQTMMADFEMRAHAMAEKGEGVTADKLTALWKNVVTDYFGETIPEDDPYFASWSRIPHLYNSPFYVYKYATCYASAAHLMEQLELNPEATVERYLTLLKSGGNDYPMEQLRKAGIDLTQPEILKSVVAEFSRLVDLLEQEYAKLKDSERLTS